MLNLKTPVSSRFRFMRKILVFLCLICSFFIVKAQKHQKKIDYQYSRSKDNYTGYTLSVDTLNKNVVIDFVANKRIKKISKLLLINGSEETDLKFFENDIILQNDDKELKSFSFIVDFKMHLQESSNCRNTIRFIASRKLYFDLPLDLCTLKKYL